ncbi:hypothetical protein JW968_05420 [Candidatus Woesearchaeota archaeon]|nr:hypothetical protein [Candidatus Woesearchaeota archaeon]
MKNQIFNRYEDLGVFFGGGSYSCPAGYFAAGEACIPHGDEGAEDEHAHCNRLCIKKELITDPDSQVITDLSLSNTASGGIRIFQGQDKYIHFKKKKYSEAIVATEDTDKPINDIIMVYTDDNNFECNNLEDAMAPMGEDYENAEGSHVFRIIRINSGLRYLFLCYMTYDYLEAYCNIDYCKEPQCKGISDEDDDPQGWLDPNKDDGIAEINLVLVPDDEDRDEVFCKIASQTFSSYKMDEIVNQKSYNEFLGEKTVPSTLYLTTGIKNEDIIRYDGPFYDCISEEGELFLEMTVTNDQPRDGHNYLRQSLAEIDFDTMHDACIAGSQYWCDPGANCHEDNWDPGEMPDICRYNDYCSEKAMGWWFYNGSYYDSSCNNPDAPTYKVYTYSCPNGCYGDEGLDRINVDPDGCSGFCEFFDRYSDGNFNWAGPGITVSDPECMVDEECCPGNDPDCDLVCNDCTGKCEKVTDPGEVGDPCTECTDCKSKRCVATAGGSFCGCADYDDCEECLEKPGCAEHLGGGDICSIIGKCVFDDSGGPRGYGYDCNAPADCLSGLCKDGKCRCTNDGDCSNAYSGHWCNTTSNLCGCQDDDDCEEEDYCDDGQCEYFDPGGSSPMSIDKTPIIITSPPKSDIRDFISRFASASSNLITGFSVRLSSISMPQFFSGGDAQDYSPDDGHGMSSITGHAVSDHMAAKGGGYPYCCGDDVYPFYYDSDDGSDSDGDCGFHTVASFCDTENSNKVTNSNSSTAGDIFTFVCIDTDNEFLSRGSSFVECERSRWFETIADSEEMNHILEDIDADAELGPHQYLCYLPTGDTSQINGTISECQGNQSYSYDQAGMGRDTPAYVGSTQNLREDNSTGIVECWYCASDAMWYDDIDFLGDEPACNSHGDGWTGQHCCGEPCDDNEVYNDDINDWFDWGEAFDEEDLDPNNPDDEEDIRFFIEDTLYADDKAVGCWDSTKVNHDESVVCTASDDGEEIESEIREVINLNGSFYGCAIGNDYIRSGYNDNPYSKPPFSYHTEAKDPNKPYNGSFTELIDFFGHEFDESFGCNLSGELVDRNDDLLDVKDSLSSGYLVEDKPYCEKMGQWYCSYQEIWKTHDDLNKTLKFIAWIPEEEPHQRAECCAQMECWNGSMCVRNMKYNQDLPQHGYRCINGNWTTSEPKYTWDYKLEGYCPDPTQCLVLPDMDNAQFEDLSVLAYYNGSKTPSCLNDTSYVYDIIHGTEKDYVCEKGNWTTRTKYVALSMLDALGGYSSKPFTLYCDDYDMAVNFYLYGVLDKPIWADYYFSSSSGCRYATTDVPCANRVCILKYGFNEKEEPGEQASKVMFGTSLNGVLENSSEWFTDVFNIANTSCSGTGESFNKCGSYSSNGVADVWYNGEYQLILASKDGASPGSVDFWDIFKSTIKRLWFDLIRIVVPKDPMLGTSLEKGFLNMTKDFDKIYMAYNPDGVRIMAVYETVYDRFSLEDPDQWMDRTFIIMEVHGTEVNLCDSLNITQPFSCEKKNNAYYISSMDENNLFSYWYELTNKLRPEYGKEDDYTTE